MHETFHTQATTLPESLLWCLNPCSFITNNECRHGTVDNGMVLTFCSNSVLFYGAIQLVCAKERLK